MFELDFQEVLIEVLLLVLLNLVSVVCLEKQQSSEGVEPALSECKTTHTSHLFVVSGPRLLEAWEHHIQLVAVRTLHWIGVATLEPDRLPVALRPYAVATERTLGLEVAVVDVATLADEQVVLLALLA